MRTNLSSGSDSQTELQGMKRKIIFYWVSLVLLGVFAAISYHFEDYISGNYLIIAFLFSVMIPVGITYLSIFFEMNSFFGYKLWIFVVPLFFWPRLSIILLASFPFFYVAYLTIVFNRFK